MVHIEKQPKVWSSGLFGIEPTDNWKTYKDAYLKEKVFKLNPLIITEIVKDIGELKELTKKLKNLTKDKKLDADELAEKVKVLVKNLDVKSTTIFDTDDAEGLVIKPHGSTKVFKYSNSVKKLEERIEKLEEKIEELIEKLDENSQSSETK